MLADDHTGTGGKSGEQADEDVHDDTHGANGGVGFITGVVAHHIGIHQIVHLLKKISQNQREGECQEVAGDTALGHIHILTAEGFD